eukprot:scaffold7791_cov1298-Pinguiococcus_pyrenoidosus.AAC.1
MDEHDDLSLAEEMWLRDQEISNENLQRLEERDLGAAVALSRSPGIGRELIAEKLIASERIIAGYPGLRATRADAPAGEFAIMVGNTIFDASRICKKPRKFWMAHFASNAHAGGVNAKLQKFAIINEEGLGSKVCRQGLLQRTDEVILLVSLRQIRAGEPIRVRYRKRLTPGARPTICLCGECPPRTPIEEFVERPAPESLSFGYPGKRLAMSRPPEFFILPPDVVGRLRDSVDARWEDKRFLGFNSYTFTESRRLNPRLQAKVTRVLVAGVELDGLAEVLSHLTPKALEYGE